MRITLGVDYKDSRDAPSLVQRLQFRNSIVQFTHVQPPSAWVPARERVLVAADTLVTESAGAMSGSPEHISLRKEGAKDLLASASLPFPCWEPCEFSVLQGNPTQMLLRHAEATSSDMIVVNASQRSPLCGFLTGSVARGVVIQAKQSVLLVRETPSPTERPLRAVLVTDHSEYMSRCLEKLEGFMPQGLSHITVLTTFPEDNARALQVRLPQIRIDIGEAIRHELESCNEALARRLRRSFQSSETTVSTQVSCAPIEEAILLTMQETEADLLIVGAQGHALLERLARSSLSLHQALTTPYSLMLLRLNDYEMDQLLGSD